MTRLMRVIERRRMRQGAVSDIQAHLEEGAGPEELRLVEVERTGQHITPTKAGVGYTYTQIRAGAEAPSSMRQSLSRSSPRPAPADLGSGYTTRQSVTQL